MSRTNVNNTSFLNQLFGYVNLSDSEKLKRIESLLNSHIGDKYDLIKEIKRIIHA